MLNFHMRAELILKFNIADKIPIYMAWCMLPRTIRALCVCRHPNSYKCTGFRGSCDWLNRTATVMGTNHGCSDMGAHSSGGPSLWDYVLLVIVFGV